MQGEAQYGYLKDADVTYVINIADSDNGSSDEDNKKMLTYAPFSEIRAKENSENWEMRSFVEKIDSDIV